jgi:hypothetical protein
MAETAEVGQENEEVFTRQQFCERNRISLSTLYKLTKANRGPKFMLVGSGSNAIRITREAEKAWHRKMEREAASAAARLERERLSKRMSLLGKRGAESPRHPCRRKRHTKE